jgi:hypothetical protein
MLDGAGRLWGRCPKEAVIYGDPSRRIARSVMSRASCPPQSMVHAIRSPLRMGPEMVGPGSSPRIRGAPTGRTKPYGAIWRTKASAYPSTHRLFLPAISTWPLGYHRRALGRGSWSIRRLGHQGSAAEPRTRSGNVSALMAVRIRYQQARVRDLRPD